MKPHPFHKLGWEIASERVWAAMTSVPRHEFVAPDQRHEAYADQALPIGHGQTISQPFIVAYMTAKLDPRPDDRILEIGSGSGYQTAILSRLAAEVCSVEIVAQLARRADKTCRRLGYENVQIRHGDGHAGWPERAPFDGIIVTCAPSHPPVRLVEQLREGGRLVIPLGDLPEQTLHLFEKRGGQLIERSSLAVRFVPMTGLAMEQ